jgi:hypothetical protein
MVALIPLIEAKAARVTWMTVVTWAPFELLLDLVEQTIARCFCCTLSILIPKIKKALKTFIGIRIGSVHHTHYDSVAMKNLKNG